MTDTTTSLWHEDTRPDRFDGVSMAIHWATLLLIVGLFATAWMRAFASDGDTAATLLYAHRSLGGALWLLTLIRLLWKFGMARTPKLPATVGPLQHLIARANEAALYALLLLQPLTGFLQSIAHGKPFALLGANIPVLMAKDKAFGHAVHDLHERGAWALLILIGLHALAALAHHFLMRDNVLRAMLPARAKNISPVRE
ncbi:MAG TPA: cytochrome b/b6 domain-containing protein [Sphingomonas sp.]|uniref:cytochrome b n=1 Tax=Sphingomonas sp. TaxID=28214 RepID=UPI002CBDCEC5|nr:cytochrome b/b6 domain-containing protein [Sphingomonas sp.]HMI20534.1 cytochrome b/b6 domain-containing protein [Sphingomonas sp.]